jgi:hypothetical protein
MTYLQQFTKIVKDLSEENKVDSFKSLALLVVQSQHDLSKCNDYMDKETIQDFINNVTIMKNYCVSKSIFVDTKDMLQVMQYLLNKNSL